MKIRFINRSVLIFALALILLGAVVLNSAWAQTGTISGRVTQYRRNRWSGECSGLCL